MRGGPALLAMGYEDYARLSAGGGLVPVHRELPGDLMTPVSAFASVAGRSRRAFLLESVAGGERVARYSFLGRDPVSTLERHDSGLVEEASAGRRPVEEPLLDAIRSRVGRTTTDVPGLPRFTGGCVGYLAYDAVRLFERVPARHPPGDRPLASFSFYRAVVAFDHARQRLVLIANVEAGRRDAFGEAQETLDALEEDLGRPAGRSHPLAAGSPPEAGAIFDDEAGFLAAVARAKGHIEKGDVFQVVLSRRRTFESAADPFAVYRALRMVNPSPYMYFVKNGEDAIAGASPEMLVRVEGGRVETRPLAGTRPRAAHPGEDARLEQDLRQDAKERAEHLMLVDLGRNDLGRVCRFGSVTVPELMAVERYSHVMHMVSTVTGELTPGRDALDALVAAFPAGTLSGAPKIRAMELIDELEPARRGLYGGALGYLDLRGNLDFCIAIRTIVMGGGRATVQAGAGIVADSDPAAELAETEAKAGAMREALRLAGAL
jgi:anthranilate synthase component I